MNARTIPPAHRPGVLRTLFLFLIFAATQVFAGESVPPYPLDRTLRLNLWGASLAETGKAINDQTGAQILFYAPDLGKEFLNAPAVHLVTGNVALATVLETLARQFAFRFRATAGGTVEISRGYNWVGGRQALRFVRTPPLTDDGAGDGALRELLAEMAKPLALLAGDFTLAFEAYPLPGQPAARRGTLVLPAVLADYVERGVRCLAGDPGDYPAPPEGAPDVLFARAREYGRRGRELASRQLFAPSGGSDLRTVLGDIALQTGTVIALAEPPAGSGPALPAYMERYTLGGVCQILADEWKLGKQVFLASGAVLFAGGDAGERESDGRTRELFWDGLAVAGFDARRAAERARGGRALATLLRRDVFPGLWRDPVCSLTYSPLRGRLAVVAPANVMPAIAKRLAELNEASP